MFGAPLIHSPSLPYMNAPYVGQDGRYCYENIKRMFTDLEASVITKVAFVEVEPLSRQWFQTLFGFRDANCFLVLVYQDTRSQVSISPNELPACINQLLQRNKGSQATIDVQVCLLEYFVLKFLALIRQYSANEQWQTFFLDGLTEIFNFLSSIGKEWTRRFFKYFELTLIAELPSFSSQTGQKIVTNNTFGAFRYSNGYISFYKFYIESYMYFLRVEFAENRMSLKNSGNFPLLKDFINSFTVIYESMITLANRFSAANLAEISDLLSSFLIIDNDEFKEFFLEKTSVTISSVLAQYLSLATESTISNESLLRMFELIVSSLGRPDQGRYKRYIHQNTLSKSPTKNILFDVYYNSVFPQLFNVLLQSYEFVAKSLGEHSEELCYKLVAKIEAVRKSEIESFKTPMNNDADVELTPNDWNYPFDVAGESPLLFGFALGVGYIIDWFFGRHSIPADQKTRMWKYHNGEKMYMDNTHVRQQPIPFTKVRWLAQRRLWLTVLIVVWLISRILTELVRIASN